MDRRLRLAHLMWAAGRPLPLTLATELFNLGYDVEALEARYRA